MKTHGFSLIEMLLTLTLMSIIALISFGNYSHYYEIYTVKTFTKQLSSALKLAEALSLTRNENLIICAQKQNICQENWHGVLAIFSDNNTLLQSFGTTPQNLTIDTHSFFSKAELIVQQHGLLINNGTFIISNQSATELADITLSKEGIITLNEKF